jgi:hypothetical protein
MSRRAAIYLFFLIPALMQGQNLPGFKTSLIFDEQQLYLENSPPGTRTLINAPQHGFEQGKRVLLVLYALPNGNTIEQTAGMRLKPGDDWHYNIQHIAAQTRFLREKIKDRTIVTVYLQAEKKSWSRWLTETGDSLNVLKGIVYDLKNMFAEWSPEIVLSSHSGGGRFIFSFIDGVDEIPADISRIAFLDSNYGYEDTLSGPKIARWLSYDPHRYLCVLAYNDSVVIFNGKQLVSPTGGTWYRSKMMVRHLEDHFSFRRRTGNSLIRYSALQNRIEIILRRNPEGKIYHTVQVDKNGFIHSILSGTPLENKGYRYFGRRAYSKYIADRVIIPVRSFNIPLRKNGAETGSEFMKRIDTIPLEKREEEIFRAFAEGNIPEFLRKTVTLEAGFEDTAGVVHNVVFEVMPDYLSVGSDSDFCRIPMNPHTAQKLADMFGASLITSKMSDFIYERAPVKLAPFNYVPVGNANELPSKFAAHNEQIEKQFREAGGIKGQLVAGIKKDVILSGKLSERSDRVVIYGWHKPGGNHIQPVYGGHVDWYVDYSHGIRLVNNQVLIDGRPYFLSDVLTDPLLFRLFSSEEKPMSNAKYPDQ